MSALLRLDLSTLSSRLPIKTSLEIYEINENTINKIQADNASDTEKVFNLLRSIQIAVEKDAGQNPYLRSIGEKADQISAQFKQRQIDTKDALERAKEQVNKWNTSKYEQAQKNLPRELFTVYWVLKEEQQENPEETASEMKQTFEDYPHWGSSEEHERKLKQQIIKILNSRKIDIKRSVELTNKILTILKGPQK